MLKIAHNFARARDERAASDIGSGHASTVILWSHGPKVVDRESHASPTSSRFTDSEAASSYLEPDIVGSGHAASSAGVATAGVFFPTAPNQVVQVVQGRQQIVANGLHCLLVTTVVKRQNNLSKSVVLS